MVGATTREEKELVDPALDALTQEARRVFPGHEQGVPLLMQGIERYMAEDWEAVTSLFESVAAPTPKDATQWNLLLILARHQTGDVSEARARFEAASPNYPGRLEGEEEYLWLSYKMAAPELFARARAVLDEG